LDADISTLAVTNGRNMDRPLSNNIVNILQSFNSPHSIYPNQKLLQTTTTTTTPPLLSKEACGCQVFVYPAIFS
jgi:hypothetical protein